MRILVFGDSISQGFWDADGGWVAYLWKNYTEQFIKNMNQDPATVFNLSISGDTLQDIIKRFDQEVSPRKYQNEKLIFLFAVGANNTIKESGTFWSTPEEYVEDLAKLLKKAKKYTDKVLFLGLTRCDEKRTLPVPWGDYWHDNERIALFDAELKKFCQGNDLPHIELIHLFKGKEEEYLSDGLHPNQKGHQVIYEKVKPELEKFLALA